MGFIPQWAIGVGVIIVAVSIARALSGVFGGGAGRRARTVTTSGEGTGELREVVEALQSRVAELEERLDFAERLLAKQREGGRLGSPPQ